MEDLSLKRNPDLIIVEQNEGHWLAINGVTNKIVQIGELTSNLLDMFTNGCWVSDVTNYFATIGGCDENAKHKLVELIEDMERHGLLNRI